MNKQQTQSQRHAAEEQLRYQAQLLQSVSDAIISTDLDFCVVSWNHAAEVIYGWTAEEALGQSANHILGTKIIEHTEANQDAKSTPQNYETALTQLFNEGRWEGDLVQKRKDGSSIYVHAQITLLKDQDGVPTGAVAVNRDITARKQAEIEGKTRLHYERELAAFSSTLLTKTPGDQAINKALKHLLRAAEVSRVYIFINFDDPEDGLCMRQTHEVCAPGVQPEIDNPVLQHVVYNEGFERWQAVLSQGQPIVGFISELPPSEQAILAPQGILSILVLPIFVRDTWHGFIGFDHTKELRAWDKNDVRILNIAAEILGAYIRNTQDEAALRQANLDLERSNADLEQFAYIVSHDLQEPLRMVTSYLGLLERHYGSQLSGHADEYIAYAVDGAKRMQALIKALLNYARVDTQSQDFAPVDCNALIERVLLDLQFPIVDQDAHVTYDPLPTVMGNAVQLRQVFQNLLANALKFHKPDTPPRIHITTERVGQAWQFAVRDNGIGIAPEYLDDLFKVFHRLHTREAYPGTGIGLAICKKIVERHGGHIGVESEPEKGSTFYFMLPA